MADPLSVIAGVVGIAGAGLALATKLYDIVDQFGSTFEDIGLIARDLDALSIVLREIARKLDAPDSDRTASDELLGGIERVISTCKTLFIDINRMIGRVETSDSIMAKFRTRVSWVFRKTRVKGIHATLGGQKATLTLMVQILQDDESAFHRAILRNLFREYRRALGALESIEKENARLRSKEKNPSPKLGKGNESTTYLPGGVSSKSSEQPSVMVVLSNAVPYRNENSSTHEESATSTQEVQVQQKYKQFEGSGREPTISAEAVSPMHPPAPDSLTRIPTATQQKSEIDLLLSRWIQRTDKPLHKTTNRAYPSRAETAFANDAASPSSGNQNDLPTLSSEKTAGKQRIEEITSQIRALDDERNDVLTKIKTEKAEVEARVDARLKLALLELEHEFKNHVRNLKQLNESSRSDLEKKLMQCEADQETRRSVEAELERCRQEYARRMRDHPSQSHESLERHIQNMQDRLAYDRVQLGNLSAIRKDLLQALRSIQKDHDGDIATREATYDQDIKKIRSETKAYKEENEQEQLKTLQIKRMDLEEKLKQLGLDLWRAREESANMTDIVGDIMPLYEMDASADNVLQQPVIHSLEFTVPHWLNEDLLAGDQVSDDESTGNGPSVKITVDEADTKLRSKPATSGCETPVELPTS